VCSNTVRCIHQESDIKFHILTVRLDAGLLDNLIEFLGFLHQLVRCLCCDHVFWFRGYFFQEFFILWFLSFFTNCDCDDTNVFILELFSNFGHFLLFLWSWWFISFDNIDHLWYVLSWTLFKECFICKLKSLIKAWFSTHWWTLFDILHQFVFRSIFIQRFNHFWCFAILNNSDASLLW